MIMTMTDITDTLDDIEIKNIILHDKNTTYWEISDLADTSHLSDARTVFIGEASRIDLSRLRNDCALIIYNDSDLELDKVGVPIVELANKTDVPSVLSKAKALHSKLVEYDNVAEKLMSTLYGEKSLQTILEEAYHTLGNPVIFQLISMENQAFTIGLNKIKEDFDQAETDPVNLNIQRMYRKGIVPADDDPEVTSYVLDAIDMVNREQIPIQINDCYLYKDYAYLLGEYKRISCSVTRGINGKPFGFLTVYDVDHYFQKEDAHNLWLFSRILSKRAISPALRNELVNTKNEQLLTGILNGEQTVLEPTLISRLHMNDYQHLYMVLIDITGMKPGEISDLRYSFSDRIFTCLITQRSKYIAILINIENQLERSQIWSYLSRIFENTGHYIGISEQFHDMDDIRLAYQQAREALIFAKKTAFPANGLSEFSINKMDILFTQISDKQTREMFICGDLLILDEYDNKNNSEYKKTLMTYFLCGFHPEEACESLSIHRNTLYYRLNRIEEILKHDLKDVEYLATMYFTDKFRKDDAPL